MFHIFEHCHAGTKGGCQSCRCCCSERSTGTGWCFVFASLNALILFRVAFSWNRCFQRLLSISEAHTLFSYDVLLNCYPVLLDCCSSGIFTIIFCLNSGSKFCRLFLQQLMLQGLDPNYVDKQGMSLLHLVNDSFISFSGPSSACSL